MANTDYGALPLSIAENMGSILNEKHGVTTGFKPTQWVDAIRPLVKPADHEAGGAVASFIVPNPIQSIETTIVAAQDGTGTPSPSNVRLISGFDSIKIYRTGKNLFNLTLEDFQTQGIEYYSTRYIAISVPSGDYTVSTNAPTGYIWAGGTLPNFVRVFQGTPKTISNTNVIFLGIAKNDMETALSYNIQIEVGDTATDYEAYNGTNVEVQLGQTVYGGSLNVTTGELTITHRSITVEAVRSVQLSSGTNRYYWASTLPDTSINGTNVVSSHFVGGSGIAEGNCYITGGSGTALVMVPTDQTLNTKALADAWCAENKPRFVYPLAEPVTVALDPADIKAIAGTNNIWTDCGEVAVVYRSYGA